MHFIQLTARCNSELSDMLIAELAEIGFDSFEETKSGFSAYVEDEKIDFEETKSLMERYSAFGPVSYGLQKIDRQNWNQQWESNYQPIVIDDQILVKAPFHVIEESYPVIITIIPKMSFGTGHHATTSQMLRFLLQYKPEKLEVADAGCGTGILAIMAEKMGASAVLAFDNDPWCIENSLENFNLNQTKHCKVQLGQTITDLEHSPFDVVLANINKNVLMSEMPGFGQMTKPGGLLFLSGFYTDDIADLTERAAQFHFELINQSAHDLWACLILKKH